MATWDRFDSKFLLCCTKYKERYQPVVEELRRVGISNYITSWDIADTPLKHILHRHITTGRHLAKMGHFSCCLAHYRAIKTAFELGSKSVLIMEDDIRFRSNIEEIQETLSLMPEDYDYAQFEIRKPAAMPEEVYIALHTKNIVNPRWMRYEDLRGGGCYALSRLGMGKMIDAIERRITDDSQILKINDFYVSILTGIRKYFCFPPVAVQAIIGGHDSPMYNYWHHLSKMGVDFHDYNTEGTVNPLMPN